jgi:hypothetical protein
MNPRKLVGLPLPREMGPILRLVNNFNLLEQQLGKNKGFIHDLTAGSTNRKYPIDSLRTTPLIGEGGRNTQPMPSQVSFCCFISRFHMQKEWNMHSQLLLRILLTNKRAGELLIILDDRMLKLMNLKTFKRAITGSMINTRVKKTKAKG